MLTSISEKNLTKILTFIFFVLGLIGILKHEMWFDELQAWLIARDSTSLIDLSRNIRYEGQPGLWHLCLYIVSRFTRNPISMQFLHLGIATLTVYLFVKYSPFSKFQKLLFSFSYFPFYEYSLISRSYGLGVLFIFVFCILFSKTNRNYLGIFVVVAILANTNIIAFLVAVSIMATLVFEYLSQNKLTSILTSKKNIFIGLIVCSFSLIAVYQILPPPDRSYGQINLEAAYITSKIGHLITSLQSKTISEIVVGCLEKFFEVLKLIWKSFVPIPNFLEYQFWGRNIIEELPSILRAGAGSIAVFIIVYLLVLFSDHAVVLFLFCLSMGLLLAFMSVIFAGGNTASKVRHIGYLFIVSLACLWLLNNYLPSKKTSRLTTVAQNYKNHFLNAILLLQVFAGTFSYTKDLFLPFSVSKDLANYIKNNQLDNLTIIGSPDFPVASLSAYLNKPIYYPFSDRFGTYVVYDDKRDKDIDFPSFLVKKIEEIQSKEQQEILLVFTQETHPSFMQEITWIRSELTIEKLPTFGKSIVAPESYYYLYLVKLPGAENFKRGL